MTDPEWINFAVALTLGLLIGAERERSKGEGPTRRSTGIRTFALVALLGAVAMHVGGVVLLATITAAVAALTGLSYFRGHDDDPGLTSEMGVLATAVLGGLAMSDALLASGLAVVVAAVFASKTLVHGFVKGVLTDAELRDGLILGFATLIVWPQLPDRFLGPLDALNPHTLWLLVVLVLTLGACGHVATRALGARYGLPIAGLASGFVSSTATIGSMAGRAAAAPTCLKAAVAGATLSTVATFLQMALLLFATNEPTLLAMTPILAAGGGAATLYGLAFTLLALKSKEPPQTAPGEAFSIRVAIALAATMALMLMVAAFLKDRLGDLGIVVGAAFAGLADTHAAAVSIASLATTGKLTPEDAVLPILIAMTTNALSKCVVAIGTGSPGFAVRIIPGLLLSIAASWAARLAISLHWSLSDLG